MKSYDEELREKYNEWVANGKPTVILTPSTDMRIADALERIADSLEKLPIITITDSAINMNNPLEERDKE